MATRVRKAPRPRIKPRVKARRNPVQQRSSATVDAILEAAIQILAREGQAGLTTNAIAARAGISVGSLYQYFPNKQAVVDALLQRHAGRVQPLLAAAVASAAGRPLAAAIDEVVGALIAAEAGDLRMAQIFHQLIPADPNSPIDQFESAIEATLAELLRVSGEVRARDLDLVATLVVRATSGVLRSTARRSPHLLRSPAFAAELAAMLRAYLLTLTAA